MGCCEVHATHSYRAFPWAAAAMRAVRWVLLSSFTLAPARTNSATMLPWSFKAASRAMMRSEGPMRKVVQRAGLEAPDVRWGSDGAQHVAHGTMP